MKSLISILICVLSVVSSLAANEQTQQSNSPKIQSTQTEESLSETNQAIENYYCDRLTELRLRAQADIRLLEVAQQPMPEWIGLDQWSEFAEAILRINDVQTVSNDLFKNSTAGPAQRLATTLSRIAEKKNDILDDMEWQTLKLKRLKNYALTAGLARLEKQQKDNSLETQPAVTLGLVTGIIYSDDNPVAIIDGTVVKQNGQIHGARIVKIQTDSVEFDKSGRTWTQHVREIQQANWK
jgi:hypothetical protein